jgi:predicted DNA-binding protein
LHPMEAQVSIRLPADVLAELDRRARKHHKARSELIRDALIAFVELPDGVLSMPPVERVRDLIGAMKGLPRDLASNPRHLAGLGRARR